MQKNNKVPQIRFAGFTDDWEQRKLGEIGANFYGGGTPNTAIDNFWNGHLAWLQSSDISEFDVLHSNPKKFITLKGLQNSAAKKIPSKSIAIVTRVGVGKVLLVPFEYSTSQDFLSISELKIDELFAIYAISKLMNIEKDNVQGTSIKGITKNELLDKSIFIPKDKTEQTAIGDFFKQLDKTIALHQREYEKYQNLKKSYLEKMFPKENEQFPEIRFPEFTDAWEQRKLGEIGTTFSGLTGKSKDDFGHGKAKYVTYLNVHSNCLTSDEMLDLIEIDDAQNQVQKGDVFFTTSSEVPDEVGLSSVWTYDISNVYLNSFCFAYRPNEKIDLNYLAYMLRSKNVRNQMILLAQGISRYNISKKSVMEINVYLPKYEEQTAIGNFFKQLDETIALHQRKCEKYKQIKQFYLERMFV